MKYLKYILLGIFSIILIFIACVIGVIYFTDFNMCGNYIHREYNSPDSSLKAVVFQRDCGATTGFSTQISILGANEALQNSQGNIYIIKGHPEKVAPQLSWTTTNELRIHRPVTGSEYKAETSWGHLTVVKIIYD